jgi:UDP-GlcNAc:undecaprenyl-phosphate/decaprenyl-phosphate GlcNAc-1-phosphate transferase
MFPATILAIAFVTALVAALLLMPRVIRFGIARQLYDMPDGERRIHTRPIPRLGGVAVFACTAGTLLLFFGAIRLDILPLEQRGFLVGLMLGGTLLFATGIVDDVRGLTPRVKLLAQIGASVVAYGFGFRIETIQLTTDLTLTLGWLALPLTLAWIVVVTNAFNLIDGMDGLAGGLALVTLLAVLAVSLVAGSMAVVAVAVVLMGAVLAFLRFNFHPARVFLGDGGSLFVGFVLAVIAVEASRPAAGAVQPIVPVLLLAVPLLDTGVAIARRWLRGVPIFGADGRHLHHQLLRLGFSQRRVAVILWQFAAGFATLGVLFHLATPSTSDLVATVAFGGALLVCLYGTRRLDYHEITLAGMVLRSGLRRARRAIRDNIHGHDLASQLLGAESVEQLNGMLSAKAKKFNFLDVQLRAAYENGGSDVPRLSAGTAPAWVLHHPLAGGRQAYVLRITGNPHGSMQQESLGRFIQSVVPSLDAWLEHRSPAADATEAERHWQDEPNFLGPRVVAAVA